MCNNLFCILYWTTRYKVFLTFLSLNCTLLRFFLIFITLALKKAHAHVYEMCRCMWVSVVYWVQVYKFTKSKWLCESVILRNRERMSDGQHSKNKQIVRTSSYFYLMKKIILSINSYFTVQLHRLCNWRNISQSLYRYTLLRREAIISTHHLL